MDSVLIIGKPNSGKSLLFNRLTGLQQKVVNFPGVTVEVKEGRGGDLLFKDYPGIYSFNPITKDEEVSVQKFNQALETDDVKAIICILDGTRLERSLLLGLQAQAEAATVKKPIIFALNMMDEVKASKSTIDINELQKKLNSPVVGISAKTKFGLAELRTLVSKVVESPSAYLPKKRGEEETKDLCGEARSLNREFGPKADVILKNQNRLDRFFLSSMIGGVVFSAVMIFMFQAIFTWAAPMMDFVETIITTLGAFISGLLPAGVLADFTNDAIFGGFGSFLVFVPQIFVLTFIIGLLEDSGYLARAAIICHRPLSVFGLTGKSFLPLLTGHACAIPAMYAARTIESPKRRLLTILALPLMSCSARLPVYSLLIAAMIPPITVAGLVGLQGLTFFILYAFGIVTALVISGILSKTTMKVESDSPMIIELPPYRLPNWRPLIHRSLNSAWTFVTKAGGIIFTVTVIVWALGYFPNGQGALETSLLASIGQFIEPIFAPLGLDWKYGVAILVSFLAREVFVGTLGTLFGIEGADENIAGLAENIQGSGLEMASGVALLVFYAIALQCVATLAMMKKELGNYKLPVLTFVGYSVLAYVLAYGSYLFVGQIFG